MEEDAALREFVSLFNGERYFEAHEVLEELWRETSGPVREVYQGLIQIAAVMVHVQRGTLEGARQLLQKKTVQALGCCGSEVWIDTASLLQKTQACVFQDAPRPQIKTV